jgi:hypothetical protein
VFIGQGLEGGYLRLREGRGQVALGQAQALSELILAQDAGQLLEGLEVGHRLKDTAKGGEDKTQRRRVKANRFSYGYDPAALADGLNLAKQSLQ